MKILAIETSSNACSVGLLINHDVKVIHEIASLQQAKRVLPLIDQLLIDSNITLNQLDALSFGCGPGSFTGVRIATSVVQGIGYAMDLPIIPISSLAAIAQAAYVDLGWKKMLVGIDARIQEVYWGAYQVNAEGLVELVNKECVCTPENVILPDEHDWYGIGNAWEIYRPQIPYKPIELDATRGSTVTGILLLARKKYEQSDWVSAENVLPTYLRNEVAKKSC